MDYQEKYSVCVWALTYYKVDNETGEALVDDDGNVIEFHLPNEDCSHVAEAVDINELERI